MKTVPPHTAWLKKTDEQLETADGRTVEVWELHHANDDAILSFWAQHFRQHYCKDRDLPALVSGTGFSNAEYLRSIKFPDATHPPGPSTRAGDFGEILVADFIEYVLGYWCPREGRYEDRENRNVPSNGSDVIGFKLARRDEDSSKDEMFVLETKAGLTPTKKNRLQQAIDDSSKDLAREAMSLNAIKQRLLKSDAAAASVVERYQNINDRPFQRVNGAAAILENNVFDDMALGDADASGHPNSARLRLFVIKGTSMMNLVHALYERASNET